MQKTKKRIWIVSAALAWVLAGPPFGAANAADVSITAAIEPSVVPVGGEATLVVTVKGKFTKGGTPELPPLEDIVVYQSGTSQSFSFGTGGASSSLQYTYVLVPRKEGVYAIEPIRIRLGDKVYTADAVTLEVVQSAGQAPAGPAPAPSGPPPRGAPADRERGEKVDAGDQPIFIRARVDRDTVFVNQQVTWTLGFYSDGRLNLLRTPEYSPPPAEAFWAEDLPSQKSTYKEIEGRRYAVNEVKRAFFASAPGEYTIGQARVDLVLDDFGRRSSDRFFDDFFSRSFGSFGFGKPVTLKTPEIRVTVLPLPQRGRPADFSGLVGRALELSVRTDKSAAQVGEPITLTLEISGEGNFKTMSAPAVAQPQGFKMYESGTASDLFKKDNVVTGRKKYEYVLIPRFEGDKTIPPVALSYFDPVEKTYKTVRSAPIALEVKPGTTEEGRRVVFAGSGEDIEVIDRDIRYIRAVPAAIRPASRPLVGSKAYMAAHAIPLVALLAAIAVERRRKRLRGDVRLARASHAAREAGKKLDRARGFLKQGKSAEVFALVSNALRGYVADKMNASASGLTRDDIERFLAERGALGADIDELKSILAACDGAQYAPAAPAGRGEESAREAVARASGLVKNLDRGCLS